MTTITIDNPEIEEKYSEYEIKRKFLYFIQTEMKEEKVELYEIWINNLSETSKSRLKNINNLNFIDY